MRRPPQLKISCDRCDPGDYDPPSAMAIWSWLRFVDRSHQFGESDCRGRLSLLFKGRPFELEYVSVTHRNRFREVYVRIPKVDDLGADDDRKYGAWLEEKNRDGSVDIYMTCSDCGGVNKITENSISRDGASECFGCSSCQFINRVVLDGWEDHRVRGDLWYSMPRSASTASREEVSECTSRISSTSAKPVPSRPRLSSHRRPRSLCIGIVIDAQEG